VTLEPDAHLVATRDAHNDAQEMLDEVAAERDQRLAQRDDALKMAKTWSDEAARLQRAIKTAQATSDGYRDLHLAWQRWAVKHAPMAIGDDQKREAIDERIAASGASGEEVARLNERHEAHLRLIASISQPTPLPSELEGWEGQRAALVAEVGALRSRVAELEASMLADIEAVCEAESETVRIGADLDARDRSIDAFTQRVAELLGEVARFSDMATRLKARLAELDRRTPRTPDGATAYHHTNNEGEQHGG
jgi:hypothetical protein